MPEQKKNRGGRPRLTDEEKQRRAAEKAARPKKKREPKRKPAAEAIQPAEAAEKPKSAKAKKQKRALGVMASSEGLNPEKTSGRNEQGMFVDGNAGGPGRPTQYSEEVAAEILRRTADGEPLVHICAEPHMPARPTVIGWYLDETHPFSDKWQRAKKFQLESFADDIVAISDDGSNDWMERQHGEDKNSAWSVNGEHVSRSKLRVQTRQWMLEKLLPEKFGPRHTIDLNVKPHEDWLALLEQAA